MSVLVSVSKFLPWVPSLGSSDEGLGTSSQIFPFLSISLWSVFNHRNRKGKKNRAFWYTIFSILIYYRLIIFFRFLFFNLFQTFIFLDFHFSNLFFELLIPALCLIIAYFSSSSPKKKLMVFISALFQDPYFLKQLPHSIPQGPKSSPDHLKHHRLLSGLLSPLHRLIIKFYC